MIASTPARARHPTVAGRRWGDERARVVDALRQCPIVEPLDCLDEGEPQDLVGGQAFGADATLGGILLVAVKIIPDILGKRGVGVEDFADAFPLFLVAGRNNMKLQKGLGIANTAHFQPLFSGGCVYNYLTLILFVVYHNRHILSRAICAERQ